MQPESLKRLLIALQARQPEAVEDIRRVGEALDSCKPRGGFKRARTLAEDDERAARSCVPHNYRSGCRLAWGELVERSSSPSCCSASLCSINRFSLHRTSQNPLSGPSGDGVAKTDENAEEAGAST